MNFFAGSTKKTLHFIFFIMYFVFCNLKRKDYMDFLINLLELSQEKPLVSYYLIIGPKRQWKKSLEENYILEKYQNVENAYLMFTN